MRGEALEPTYSNVLGNLAGGIPFLDPDTGKVYSVSYLTPRKMAEFEKWMLSAAVRTVMAAKEMLPPEVYEAQLNRVLSMPYKFHSTYGLSLLNDVPGVFALAGLLFDLPDAEMMDLWVRWGQEVGALIAHIVIQSHPRHWLPAEEPGRGNRPPLTREQRVSETRKAWEEADARLREAWRTNDLAQMEKTSTGSSPTSSKPDSALPSTPT